MAISYTLTETINIPVPASALSTIVEDRVAVGCGKLVSQGAVSR